MGSLTKGIPYVGGIRFVGTVGSFTRNGSASALILLGTFAKLWIRGVGIHGIIDTSWFLVNAFRLGR